MHTNKDNVNTDIEVPEPATTSAALSLQNRTSSPLLRLPAELRNTIYHYVIGGLVMQPQEETSGPGKARVRHAASTTRSREWHSPQILLSLTQICRQIHRETSMLHFSLNSFEIAAEGLVQFRRFVTTLSTQQRSAITTINIDDEFFDVIDYLSIHDVTLGPPIPETGFEGALLVRPLRDMFAYLEGLARVVVIVHILPPVRGARDLDLAIKHDTERARKKGQVACTWLRSILDGRTVEIVAQETYIRYNEKQTPTTSRPDQHPWAPWNQR